jgi:hypothetical protein
VRGLVGDAPIKFNWEIEKITLHARIMGQLEILQQMQNIPHEVHPSCNKIEEDDSLEEAQIRKGLVIEKLHLLAGSLGPTAEDRRPVDVEDLMEEFVTSVIINMVF